MAWKSGQSYSSDLRSRVLAAMDGGEAAKVVARQFQVSVSYIYKALGRRNATGETEARPQRNHQTLKLKDLHAAIAAEVASRSDITLEELRAWLQLFFPRSIPITAIRMVSSSARCPPSLAPVGGGGPSHKSGRAQEQDRPDVAQRRADWRAKQGAMSPARLVFVDETGAATNMARRYGRSPRGRAWMGRSRTATGRAPPSSAG